MTNKIEDSNEIYVKSKSKLKCNTTRVSNYYTKDRY